MATVNIRTIVLAAALIYPAVAHADDAALATKLAMCSAYHFAVEVCAENNNRHDTAKIAGTAAEEAFNLSVDLSDIKVALARAEIYGDQMIDVMGDCSRISVLVTKYNALCNAVTEIALSSRK